MHTAFRYWRGSHYIDQVDEIIINFDPDTFSAEKLNNFCNKYNNQRIILKVKESDAFIDFETLKIIKNAKCAIMFDCAYNPVIYEYMRRYRYQQDFDIPFFFNYLVATWDFLYYVRDSFPIVSDIYISGELGFCLPTIKNIVNANIRVIVNLCQSSTFLAHYDPILTFFIRPEDLWLYDGYIDTIEFSTQTNKGDEVEKQDVLYKIYTKDEKWLGDLSQIISGFDKPIDNSYINIDFGLHRLKCDKRCMKGRYCNACTSQYGYTMRQKEFIKLAETAKNKIAKS